MIIETGCRAPARRAVVRQRDVHRLLDQHPGVPLGDQLLSRAVRAALTRAGALPTSRPAAPLSGLGQATDGAVGQRQRRPLAGVGEPGGLEFVEIAGRGDGGERGLGGRARPSRRSDPDVFVVSVIEAFRAGDQEKFSRGERARGRHQARRPCPERSETVGLPGPGRCHAASADREPGRGLGKSGLELGHAPMMPQRAAVRPAKFDAASTRVIGRRRAGSRGRLWSAAWPGSKTCCSRVLGTSRPAARTPATDDRTAGRRRLPGQSGPDRDRRGRTAVGRHGPDVVLAEHGRRPGSG